MRTAVFTLLLICKTLPALAQGFAPVGSRWMYCYAVNALGGAEGLDSLVVESVAETQVDTLPCRNLQVTYCYSHGSYGCGLMPEVTVCQDGKKVFYQEGDSLYLLYDFGAMPGDTVKLRYPLELDSMNQWVVDSQLNPYPAAPYFDVVILDTGTVDYNGQMVWTQTFDGLPTNDFITPSWGGGQFLENIGSLAGGLFPRAISALQETHIPLALMWYKNPQGIVLSPNVSPFCATLLAEDHPVQATFSVWPNPAGTILNLTFSKNSVIEQTTITDVTGNTVQHNSFPGAGHAAKTDVSDLTPGIYFFKVLLNHRSQVAGRFVKN
jgi:hypothetical protein